MKTSRGIYLNLKESEYSFSFHGLIFYFSSKQYLEKFANNVQNYIKGKEIVKVIVVPKKLVNIVVK